ncbi:MAG: lysostaphin resistance A-like protein [Leucothrix sp.]
MTPKEPHPIGLGLTLFYSVMVIIFYALIQSAVLQHFINEQSSDIKDFNALAESLSTDATVLSIGISLAASSAILFLVLLIRFRKVDVKQHLALQPFIFRDLINGFIVLLGFTLLLTFVAWLISHETPDFMNSVWASRDNMLLLFFAIVIAAPVFEECLFRGFIFSGVQNSHLGTAAAIVISAACWTMIHTQYGAFELVTIFILGILFAVSRIASGSLYVPIILHASNNLFALLEMALITENVAQ